MRSLVRALVAITVTMAPLGPAACGSSSNVPEASCSACVGASYSEAECKAWGKAAGCESSAFVPTVTGCTNGCKFTGCQSPPDCTPAQAAKDAAADVPRDPACAEADNDSLGRGLFSSIPPCSNYKAVTINGNTRYTCSCGQCPCGYQCGSIALTAGGFLGSVCSP